MTEPCCLPKMGFCPIQRKCAQSQLGCAGSRSLPLHYWQYGSPTCQAKPPLKLGNWRFLSPIFRNRTHYGMGTGIPDLRTGQGLPAKGTIPHHEPDQCVRSSLRGSQIGDFCPQHPGIEPGFVIPPFAKMRFLVNSQVENRPQIGSAMLRWKWCFPRPGQLQQVAGLGAHKSSSEEGRNPVSCSGISIFTRGAGLSGLSGHNVGFKVPQNILLSLLSMMHLYIGLRAGHVQAHARARAHTIRIPAFGICVVVPP